MFKRLQGRKKAAPAHSYRYDPSSIQPTNTSKIYDDQNDENVGSSSEAVLKVRGNIKNVQTLYIMLSANPQVKTLIDNTGWIGFLQKDYGKSDRNFVFAIVERWSTRTHTFQFPSVELGISPFDFTTLTGITVGASNAMSEYMDPDVDVMSQTPYTLLPGYQNYDPNIKNRALYLPNVLKYIEATWQNRDNIVNVARAFCLYMVGSVFFPNGNNTVGIGWLLQVASVSSIKNVDWGSAILARIFLALDAWKQGKQRSLDCFWQLIEYFFYEYLATACPVLIDPDVPAWPRMLRWSRDNRAKVRDGSRFSFHTVRQQLELLSPESVRWDTFRSFRYINPIMSRIFSFSCGRFMLLDPQTGGVYYLGERCARQLIGSIVIPFDPPTHMSHIDRASYDNFIYNHINDTNIEMLSRPATQAEFDEYFSEWGRGPFLPPLQRVETQASQRTSSQRHSQRSIERLKPEWVREGLDPTGQPTIIPVVRPDTRHEAPAANSFSSILWREAYTDYVDYSASLRQVILEQAREIEALRQSLVPIPDSGSQWPSWNDAPSM